MTKNSVGAIKVIRNSCQFQEGKQMLKKLCLVLSVVVLAACVLGQLAIAGGVWGHYYFEEYNNAFGFKNEETGQIVLYGTVQYGQIAMLRLPPSLRNAGGKVTCQNELYYFFIPGQPGSDLIWHAGIGLWRNSLGR
ncbi:hypothetical protein A2Y83_02480 [Candidatus Falkowbacteria bacterium RBG_13_39_14]|uniref:Uncharacterized protein n=1 Tax=Candidatus Falkowbacteria bacterium RBG_13_39_14 TaxID=1797985 RepID=A0A1F5S7N5_9BACT|nr:MAG: hypothetical protein A2Y83_02480 [Candidatus Falkowbacteria bacterium RBG_13_39_14]